MLTPNFAIFDRGQFYTGVNIEDAFNFATAANILQGVNSKISTDISYLESYLADVSPKQYEVGSFKLQTKCVSNIEFYEAVIPILKVLQYEWSRNALKYWDNYYSNVQDEFASVEGVLYCEAMLYCLVNQYSLPTWHQLMLGSIGQLRTGCEFPSVFDPLDANTNLSIQLLCSRNELTCTPGRYSRAKNALIDVVCFNGINDVVGSCEELADIEISNQYSGLDRDVRYTFRCALPHWD